MRRPPMPAKRSMKVKGRVVKGDLMGKMIARGGSLPFRHLARQLLQPRPKILRNHQFSTRRRTHRISADVVLAVDDVSRSIGDRLHDARVDRVASGGA